MPQVSGRGLARLKAPPGGPEHDIHHVTCAPLLFLKFFSPGLSMDLCADSLPCQLPEPWSTNMLSGCWNKALHNKLCPCSTANCIFLTNHQLINTHCYLITITRGLLPTDYRILGAITARHKKAIVIFRWAFDNGFLLLPRSFSLFSCLAVCLLLCLLLSSSGELCSVAGCSVARLCGCLNMCPRTQGEKPNGNLVENPKRSPKSLSEKRCGFLDGFFVDFLMGFRLSQTT